MLKPSDFTKEQLIQSNPMVKRKYVYNDGKLNYDKIALLKEENIRCLYEFFTRYHVLKQTKISDYVSVSYLLKTINEDSTNENLGYIIKDKIINNLTRLINHGWYRYLIKRGGKLQTISIRE